jgi:hypothetical protein
MRRRHQHRPSELLTASDNESIPDVSKMLEDFGDIPELRMAQFARSDQELTEMLRILTPFSLVSLVRVRFLFPACHRKILQSGQTVVRRAELPFYPLPIRADDGTIYFPKSGDGVYVVEEVRAMLRWVREVYAHAEASERPMIALLGALEFVPINDAKPLETRVEHDFNERAAIINRTNKARAEWESGGKQGTEPYDVRELILKLGLNSLYGKTAQSKGARVMKSADGTQVVRPPIYSNMFYAAATTGGTRAMLLDPTRGDPDAVIMFATDGVCSIRECAGLDIPAVKTLGTWERAERQNGVFVKSSIYSHEPESPGAERKRTTKMRGVRPMNLGEGMTAEQWLIEAAPEAWAEDREALEFPYQAYKTFGAAVVSSKTWRYAGHWLAGTRRAEIQHVSLKRDSSGIARSREADGFVRQGERRRAKALFDTVPAANPLGWSLSRAYRPDWIDGKLALRVNAEEEQKTLECKGGFGGDRE